MPGFLSIVDRWVDVAGALILVIMGSGGVIEWSIKLSSVPLSDHDRHLAMGSLVMTVVMAAIGARWLRNWLHAQKHVEKTSQ